MTKPTLDRYRLAEEWRPHNRVWMAWPCRDALWGDRIDQAKEAYTEVAKAIASTEPVVMAANPADVVEASLACGKGVGALAIAHVGCSMRALGPSFLVGDDGVAALAWGDQADALGQENNPDDLVARSLLDHLDAPVFPGPLALEGGAFDVNGAGLALVTEPYFDGEDRSAVEAAFATMGVDRLIWLKSGLPGDVTGGHVMMVARFIRRNVVVAAVESDHRAPWFGTLQENVARLKATIGPDGSPLKVVEVPLPRPMTRPDGTAICASYASLFVGETLIIVPAFEDRADDQAYDRIVEAVPDVDVISLPALDIAYGGGGLHSIALPEPEE